MPCHEHGGGVGMRQRSKFAAALSGYDGVMAVSSASATAGAQAAATTVLPILLAVSAGHFLNDIMQSALLSIYPLIKEPLALDFVLIGIIPLAFQLTASILQPMIGLYSDKHPQPFSLPVGMASTFVGMLVLSVADGFATMLLAAALIGIGILSRVGLWYRDHLALRRTGDAVAAPSPVGRNPGDRIGCDPAGAD